MLSKKKLSLGVSVVFILLFTLSFISAITGSIGNARMILTAKEGDVIDKTILVINNNNVSVVISLSTSGDLEDHIEILDNNFTLQPGEEMKARIKITVAEAGSTETQVDVKFTPVDGKNGVGLSSKIIVNAEETGFWDFLDRGNESESTDNSDEKDSEGSFLTVVLFLVFFILLVVLGWIVYSFFKNKNSDKEIRTKTQKRRVRSF